MIVCSMLFIRMQSDPARGMQTFPLTAVLIMLLACNMFCVIFNHVLKRFSCFTGKKLSHFRNSSLKLFSIWSFAVSETNHLQHFPLRPFNHLLFPCPSQGLVEESLLNRILRNQNELVTIFYPPSPILMYSFETY